VVAGLVLAAAIGLSIHGLGRPAPPGYQLDRPDICWLAADEDCVLVCARSGRLIRLSPELVEDERGWGRQFIHPAGFWGRPALVPGHVLIGCGDVRLRGVAATTGLEGWEAAVGGAVPGVTASGEYAYFGSEDGAVHAVTSEGTLLWSVEVGGKVATAPLVTEQTVVVGTLKGDVCALARADGEELWRVHVGGPVYASPRMGPSTILVGDDGGMLHNIAREGELLASYEFGGLVRAPVAVAGAVVVAGDSAGTLARIDPSTMEATWTATLPGPVAVEPIIIGDTIWCAAGKSLVGVRASDGEVLSRRIAEAETSDCIAAHGRIYWATADGRIRAVEIDG